MATPPKIFVSYSHDDRKWLERLQVHFKALERDGDVDLWDDTEIKFGAKWDHEIEQALDEAKVAILLVSADFMASEYIADKEQKRLLEANEREDLLILMVILRPCVLGKLAQFQTVNDPAEPLEGMTRVEQEKVFVNLVETIKKVLVVKSKAPTKPESPREASLRKTPKPLVKLGITHTDTLDQIPKVQVFRQERIAIGRDPASDLLLHDPLKRVISKQHAEITFDDGTLYVTDLDSMNFTYLDEERLQPHHPSPIQPGSTIQIGPFKISVETLDTEPDDDRTFIDIANPYKDDVEQLATVLRRIGAQYTANTSRRDRVMLQKALQTALTDAERNEAYLLIARWLLKEVGSSSSGP